MKRIKIRTRIAKAASILKIAGSAALLGIAGAAAVPGIFGTTAVSERFETAFLPALAGTAQAEELPEEDYVVCTVNGEEICNSAFTEMWAYYEEAFRTAGYDTKSEDMIAYLQECVWEAAVNSVLMRQGMEKDGYYDFTQEEEAAFESEAREELAAAGDEKEHAALEGETEEETAAAGDEEMPAAAESETEDEAAAAGAEEAHTASEGETGEETAAVGDEEAPAEYSGDSEASLAERIEAARDSEAYRRLQADLEAQISFQEEEIQEYYEELVARDEEIYQDNIAGYEAVKYYTGTTLWYIPEGYRQILQIVLDSEDEDLEAKTEEILDSAQNGEAFRDLVKEYTIDETATDEEVLAQGYYIHTDSVVWSEEMIAAAFSEALQEPGDLTVFTDDSGTHILYYIGDLQSGPAAEYTEAREYVLALMEEDRLQELNDEYLENLYADAAVLQSAEPSYLYTETAEETAAETEAEDSE